MHEPCGIQFTHARVDQGVACFASFPSFKMGVVVAPWDAVVLRPERVLRAVGEGMDDGLVEIAPNQLRQPFVAVLEPEFGQFSDAHRPKPEVHADARGPALGWQVSGVGVMLQHVDIDEGLGRFDGAPFKPHFLKTRQVASIPAGEGVEVMFRGGGLKVGVHQVGVPTFAVRGEHGVGEAVGFGHFPWGLHHVVFVGVECHAAGLEHLPNLGVALQGVRLVILVRVDFRHLKTVAQRGEHVQRVSMFHPQASAVLTGVVVEVGHAVVQERHPGVVCRVQGVQNGAVKHEHRQHLVP